MAANVRQRFIPGMEKAKVSAPNWDMIKRKDQEPLLFGGGGMLGYTAHVRVNVARRCQFYKKLLTAAALDVRYACAGKPGRYRVISIIPAWHKSSLRVKLQLISRV